MSACQVNEVASLTAGTKLRHHPRCSVVLATDNGCIPAKHIADQVSPLTLQVSLSNALEAQSVNGGIVPQILKTFKQVEGE